MINGITGEGSQPGFEGLGKGLWKLVIHQVEIGSILGKEQYVQGADARDCAIFLEMKVQSDW